MPSIKKGTVSDDIATTIKATQGSFDWKGDKMGTIQTTIGRVSLSFDSFGHVNLNHCLDR